MQHFALKAVAEDRLPFPRWHSSYPEAKFSNRYRGYEQCFDELGV